jgi:hypothetical protein
VSKPADRDVSGVFTSARHSNPSLGSELNGSSAQATIFPVPVRTSLTMRWSTALRFHHVAPA